MHIDVNSYQLMLGYTYEILHINGATSPQEKGEWEGSPVITYLCQILSWRYHGLTIQESVCVDQWGDSLVITITYIWLKLI